MSEEKFKELNEEEMSQVAGGNTNLNGKVEGFNDGEVTPNESRSIPGFKRIVSF